MAFQTDEQVGFLDELFIATHGQDWINSFGWQQFAAHAANHSDLSMRDVCESYHLYGLSCSSDNNYIYSLNLTSNNLTGTIPSSICNVIPNGVTQQLVFNSNLLAGTLPNCTIKTMVKYTSNYFKLSITNNKMTGTLNCGIFKQPRTNHNPPSLMLANNSFYGTIPDCISSAEWCDIDLSYNDLSGTVASLWNVQYLLQLSNNQLNGTLPYNVIKPTQDRISHIYCDLSNNMLNGTITSLFWQNIYQVLKMNGNSQYSGNYFNILLNNNQFTLLEFHNLPNITNVSFYAIGNALTIHNNKLANNNIGMLLNNFFQYLHLSLLTLHDNSELTGDLNTWNITMNAPSLDYNYFGKYLTLHNCNIFGKINDPNKQTLLPNIDYFSIYGNRLSCKLNKNFATISNGITNMNSNRSNSPSIHGLLLLGNMFEFPHNNPKSIDILDNSPFITATNLYITSYENIIDITYLSCSALCLLLIIILKCKDILTKSVWQHYNYGDHELKHKFLDNIKFVFSILSNWVVIINIVCLSVMYYLSNHYYECGQYISHWNLTYLMDTSEPLNSNLGSIILICNFITFYIVILTYLFYWRFYFGNYNDSDDQLPIHENIFDLTTSPESRSINFKNSAVDDSSCDEDDNINTKANNLLTTCYSILMLSLWIGCYGIGCISVIIYVIKQTLPTDNIFEVFGDNGSESKLMDYILDYMVAVLLTIINVLVVPRMVDQLFCVLGSCCSCINYQYCRSQLMLSFRSMITIIIPLMASVIFLNDCGNYWTKLWKPCLNENDSFDYSFSTSIYPSIHVTLSTHTSICYVKDFGHLLTKQQLNKCLRSYFDHWVPVITAKLLLFIINPFILYFGKKHQIDDKFKMIANKCCCGCCKCLRPKKQKSIMIETEYAVISTKLDICIMFALVAPHIIPLTAFALYTNWIVYSWLATKLNWKFVNGNMNLKEPDQMTTNNDIYVQYPIFGLISSVVCSQCLLTLFYSHFVDSKLVVVLSVMFGAMDLLFVLLFAKKLFQK